MKRTTQLLTLSVAALVLTVGCVKSVEQPALAGPSTYAHSIVMTATTDTLTINGVDSTDITITSLSPTGQSENIPLRAQTFVGGVAVDFGTLSTKTPTTPATIRYTAPASSALSAQSPTTVTIRVTPTINGDFRAEFARELDLRLLPQGVIVPINPNLVAAFDPSTTTPQAFQTVTFNASTTLNGTTACGALCTYAWNFGDGTTGAGITTTKSFRAAGTFPVTLTVTDAVGAQASTTRVLTVSNVAPPAGNFTTSPSTNLGTDMTIFFDASQVTWDGRNIIRYSWDFGDGNIGSGRTTSHFYRAPGSFTVILTLTDDQGATTQKSQTLVITSLGGAAASFTASTTAPRTSQRVFFDATASTPSSGARIVSYRYVWGDGTEDTSSDPIQSHIFNGANGAKYTVTLVITDSNGKVASTSQTLTITN